MDYKENLARLEPPLPTLFSPSRSHYKVAYLKAPHWNSHDHCNLWQTWYICRVCADIGRQVRIQDEATGKTFGTQIAILNLFSNRLTDREKKSTKLEK